MSTLRVEGLSKTYKDGTRALIDVSFTVEPGEFVVILGKSGSGKSTLLRCLNRLVEPTSGRVFFGEREITGSSPRELRALRRRMGMIFQQFNLVGRASVLTNALAGRLGYLSPWAALLNYFPADAVAKACGYLEEMGIAEKRTRRADLLSGGQQQRVGIARALMQDPHWVLADEPVASLDPVTSQAILDILRQINREKKVTVLCNLHVPQLAMEYGQRVLGLQAGRLVFDGLPEDLDRERIQSIYSSN